MIEVRQVSKHYELTDDFFNYLERLTGRTLYEWQRNYIKGAKYDAVEYMRAYRADKTRACILRLLLAFDGELDEESITAYADYPNEISKEAYQKYFVLEVIRVNNQLTRAGVKTTFALKAERETAEQEVNEALLDRVEGALGFKLYDWQRNYLLGLPYVIPASRRTGKTTAYILNMLINNDTVLHDWQIADLADAPKTHIYKMYFVEMVKKINAKLKENGIMTCYAGK